VSGFILLARGTDTRRVPFWFRVERPQLQRERQIPLARPGTYSGNTARGVARVSTYRYPELPPGDSAFPITLPGRESGSGWRARGGPAGSVGLVALHDPEAGGRRVDAVHGRPDYAQLRQRLRWRDSHPTDNDHERFGRVTDAELLGWRTG